MMRQGTWKIIKLNMWLAREEVPATVVMMLLAAVSLFCISRMLLLCLLGFICMIIGFYFLERTMYKIFGENRYGNSAILVNMLPVDEKTLRGGGYLVAAGVVLICVLSLPLGFFGGYFSLTRYHAADAIPSFLRWLYCGSNTGISDGAVYAMLPLELIFVILLTLCITTEYERVLVNACRKNDGSLPERSAIRSDIPWLFFLGGVLLPRLAFLAGDRVPPLLILLVKILIVGTAAYFLMKHMPELTATKVKTRRTWEFESKDGNKAKAYEKLVGGKGKMMDWKSVICIVLVICVFIRNAGVSSSLIIVFLAALFSTFGTVVQSWNTAILLDENAPFYYSLPVRTEDIVKVHMKSGFKCMALLPLLCLALIPVTAVFEEGREKIVAVMTELIGKTDGGLETTILFLIWVLIITVLMLTFSGWGLFNSAFSGRWRDPLTHKTSRLAGGLCLSLETIVHMLLLVFILPFKIINPIAGSLLILTVCAAECVFVYRICISELRDMYSA